jgi:hypothetical protein
MATRKRAILSAVAFVLTLNVSSLTWATNLVTNGDFSSNTGLGQLGYKTTATDWSSPTANAFNFIVNANADSTGFPSQNSPPNIFIWGPNTGVNSGLNPQFVNVANNFTGPPNGEQYWLGMDGAYDTGPVEQTINGLTPGSQYTLSFYYAKSQFALGADNSAVMGSTLQSLSVSLGSETANVITNSPLASQGFSGWSQFTTTFTATSASETLTFMAGGSPAGLPPFLMVAGVDLEPVPIGPAVPEPTSVALLGIGLAGLVVVARRNRRARAV